MQIGIFKDVSDVPSKPGIHIFLWPRPIGIYYDLFIAEHAENALTPGILHFAHHFNDRNAALRDGDTGTGLRLLDKFRQPVLGLGHGISHASTIAITAKANWFLLWESRDGTLIHPLGTRTPADVRESRPLFGDDRSGWGAKFAPNAAHKIASLLDHSKDDR